ncbi:MAG: SMP-30/gluconolactonase/LRE family protein [Pseudomonadota bacterium]
MQAELLVRSDCILAEGIQWNPVTERVYWTDIHGRSFWSCDADGGNVRSVETIERLGSFAFDPAGHILAAFESGLFRWDPEGDRLDRLTDFEPDQPSTRYNDGRCDRQGRFLVGGMNEDGLKPTSSLTRYAGGQVATLATDIGCSNSICFSPDGATIYFADSPTAEIRQASYDPESGAVGTWSVLLKLAEGEGFPDGSSVDAEGHLWNARFNGADVVEVRPDGSTGRRVTLPVPQVTCCCFGGPALDRLYITTAREQMSEADVAANPLSGCIFVAEPGATGLLEDRYAERLFPTG